MAKVREDEYGLYVASGGWCARPIAETQFRTGDDVAQLHFGGSNKHGIGKDESCGRGVYLETWHGFGVMYEIRNDPEKKKSLHEWYADYNKQWRP